MRDIRKMQEKAGRPLKEIAETRKESIFKEMERMKASLLLLDELLSANVQYDTMPIEELWEYVQQKEQAAKISWMLERKAALFQRPEIYAVRIAIRNCALTLKSFRVDRPAMIMILEWGKICILLRFGRCI